MRSCWIYKRQKKIGNVHELFCSPMCVCKSWTFFFFSYKLISYIKICTSVHMSIIIILNENISRINKNNKKHVHTIKFWDFLGYREVNPRISSNSSEKKYCIFCTRNKNLYMKNLRVFDMRHNHNYFRYI